MNSVLIYNARLLDESIDGPGAIFLLNGKIRSVFQGYYTNLDTLKSFVDSILLEDGYENENSVVFFDAKGLTVMPSFIDMHVHLRDPGLTHKEDLNSALHAAVKGGYGTVVAMPNTSPVISSFEQACEVDLRAEKLKLSRVIQSVSITKDFDGETISHLEGLDSQVVPLITEDGHDVRSATVMLEAMGIASSKKIIVSCHCEDPDLAEKARLNRRNALELMKKYSIPAWGSGDYDCPEEVAEEIFEELSEANYILALAENIATERNINLARAAGAHIHLCHVSTVQAIEAIRSAKQELKDIENDFYYDAADSYEHANEQRPFSLEEMKGFSVTCEVTPHHLALTGIEEPEIFALVNPPLRDENDRLSIIEAIRDGTVDVISTDHAPHTFEDKANGAPGFTGLETSYSVCNTILVKDGQIDAKRLSQLMSANPARILKLNKGLLKSGYDADITIADPDEEWKIDSQEFFSKGKATPFDGKIFTGKVKAVFLNGTKVF